MVLKPFFPVCVLFARNLINTPLMTPSFEGGCKEFIHNSISFSICNESAWHNQNVGIVMLTDEMCYLWNPAQASSNTLMFIKCYADALTTAANGYAWIYRTRFNGSS